MQNLDVQSIKGEESIDKPEIQVSHPRPFIRYWARLMDNLIFSAIMGVFLGLSDLSIILINNNVLKFIVLLLWVFVEPILLAKFGTTPGKWLFKISLRDMHGNKLSFLQAFKRSFMVWFKGQGLGIFSLITLIIACNNLEKNGITTWDKNGELIVTHGKIGVLHTIVSIIFFIGYFMIILN